MQDAVKRQGIEIEQVTVKSGYVDMCGIETATKNVEIEQIKTAACFWSKIAGEDQIQDAVIGGHPSLCRGSRKRVFSESRPGRLLFHLSKIRQPSQCNLRAVEYFTDILCKCPYGQGGEGQVFLTTFRVTFSVKIIFYLPGD